MTPPIRLRHCRSRWVAWCQCAPRVVVGAWNMTDLAERIAGLQHEKGCTA